MIDIDACTKDEVRAMLDKMRLNRTDRTIAQMRLIDCELYVDIGAAVGYDRRTVARHIARIMNKIQKTI